MGDKTTLLVLPKMEVGWGGRGVGMGRRFSPFRHLNARKEPTQQRSEKAALGILDSYLIQICVHVNHLSSRLTDVCLLELSPPPPYSLVFIFI